MFPTIRESAAVVSIILLLMLFLPANRLSLYNRPGRGSCARKRRGVPADVAGAPYIRTQGLRPL
jgi:hypothetical protein